MATEKDDREHAAEPWPVCACMCIGEVRSREDRCYKLVTWQWGWEGRHRPTKGPGY